MDLVPSHDVVSMENQEDGNAGLRVWVLMPLPHLDNEGTENSQVSLCDIHAGQSGVDRDQSLLQGK